MTRLPRADRPTRSEPTRRELRAIEAEWPLIAADLAVVDAEIAAADEQDRPGAAVVVCLVCRADFDSAGSPGEAAYFAATHNDLHHGSAPVAFTRPGLGW